MTREWLALFTEIVQYCCNESPSLGRLCFFVFHWTKQQWQTCVKGAAVPCCVSEIWAYHVENTEPTKHTRFWPICTAVVQSWTRCGRSSVTTNKIYHLHSGVGLTPNIFFRGGGGCVTHVLRGDYLPGCNRSRPLQNCSVTKHMILIEFKLKDKILSMYDLFIIILNGNALFLPQLWSALIVLKVLHHLYRLLTFGNGGTRILTQNTADWSLICLCPLQGSILSLFS